MPHGQRQDEEDVHPGEGLLLAHGHHWHLWHGPLFLQGSTHNQASTQILTAF